MKKIILNFICVIFIATNAVAQNNGFSSITNLDPVAISTNTGEKPQSKVWSFDGKQWAILPTQKGTYLWRLDGTIWTNVLTLSTRTTSKADCKQLGDISHIFLYQGKASQLVTVEYVPQNKTYQLWRKRTSTVGISLEAGVETATIDIDGNGRMWLASAGVSDINVRWSDSPYNKWSSPVTVATGVKDDDICAVIYLPGKTGVLWSNQNTQRFGFKTHNDGDNPSTWSTDEVPASQSAMNIGGGMADDHMNMAVASDGTLYCAVKTSYDTKSSTKLALLIRRPSGIWDDLYEVSQTAGTRPIAVLNEWLGKLRIVYTAGDNGGNILYRETSVSKISFSPVYTLMQGVYNNSTSTKANFYSDIVILASSDTKAVGVLATDQGLPMAVSVPQLISPVDLSTGVSTSPTLSWSTAQGAVSYGAQVSPMADFSTLVANLNGMTATSAALSGLASGTTYYWRVRASNADGTSDWSAVWSFTTAPATPTTTLVGNWKMDEGGGSTLVDASGYNNGATTMGNPGWVTGVSGMALKLNGSSQYATAPSSASLNTTSAITVAAWIRPDKAATQYIIKKAIYGDTDGYELSLSSGGQVFFRMNQKSSGDTYRVNSTATYPSNSSTWMHIAATYDGSEIKVYLNGVLSASKSFSGGIPIQPNALAVAIGAGSDGDRIFNGAIDDVRIYNVALAPADITTLAGGLSAMSTKLASAEKSVFEADEAMTAYPNPFDSKANISFKLPEGGEYSFALYDITGKLAGTVIHGKTEANKENTVVIDGSLLARGVYFVKIESKKRVHTLKLLLDR